MRMGPRGRLTPKGLIPVGGHALVAQSVATLRSFGVRRIRIVTGHLHHMYHAAFGTDADVELIHNPDYETTGSLLTLVRGIDGIAGPVVVLESDLIYAPAALDAALAGGNRLITSGRTGAGDEVYVWTDTQGHLAGISKDPDAHPAAPFGELVGITALRPDEVDRLRSVGPRVLSRVPAEHYEAGMVALGRETPIPCVRIDDLPWAEVDDEAMLTRASTEVYPRIAAARADWGITAAVS